jgi:hypothetical protein
MYRLRWQISFLAVSNLKTKLMTTHPKTPMSKLDDISETIRAELENTSEIRDKAIAQSRILIRQCANT